MFFFFKLIAWCKCFRAIRNVFVFCLVHCCYPISSHSYCFHVSCYSLLANSFTPVSERLMLTSPCLCINEKIRLKYFRVGKWNMQDQWPVQISLHSHSFPIHSHFSYYLLPFCSCFVFFWALFLALKIAACHSQMWFKWQSTDEAFRCSPDYLLKSPELN